jgi:DNA-binding transcriptional regulator YdaS (Cro superfamily)
MTEKTGIQQAVDHFKGSKTALAEAIGDVSRQSIGNWLTAGKVPVEHCPAVQAATGLPCELLRPGFAWEKFRRQLKSKKKASA